MTIDAFAGPAFFPHGPGRDPTPVPAPERVRGPAERRSRGYDVEGVPGMVARWVTCLGGALRVEVTDGRLGVVTVETLEDLNRAADRAPGSIAAKVLRAVEGGRS